MKILLLSTHLNAGGITRYILTLAKGLKDKGHQVYVISSGGDMVPELELSGIKHVSLISRTKSELNLRIYFALGRVSKFIKDNKIEVLHAQTRITQVMGTLLQGITKTAYVTTCHGFYKNRLSRKVFGGWGDKVIAISNAVKKQLIDDFKIAAEKVVLVHNGIELNDFSIVTQELREKNRREFNLGHEPVIGIIARLADEKGHAVLIDAMRKVVAKIPTAKLIIVGKGKQEENLRKKVTELGLGNCIYFYPIVNRTADMLSLLDVFVMPSLQEGFGLSILEAMAVGIPVVATNVGGIPSIISDGTTGLMVPSGNVDALASAIIILLQNKDKAREMSREAKRMVSEKFSSEKMVMETLKVYEDCVGKRHV